MRVTGGYDTVTLANATALAEAIEGSLGAAAGIWLSQSAWDNLQDNFSKIDMDRVPGNEDGTDIIELFDNNIQHIKKHSFDGMKEQSKYLTDE